jgi:hypothetical protein
MSAAIGHDKNTQALARHGAPYSQIHCAKRWSNTTPRTLCEAVVPAVLGPDGLLPRLIRVPGP